MSAKFFAILTHQGAARLANAAALGTTLNLTQMAVGDANGALPVPDPAQTKLLNQKRIAPLNLLSIDPNNASQIIAEQIIPENEGGFWIREIGLYDDAGVLIAVANCPETYKPLLQEGSGRTQTIRMVLIVSSTESVTLKIDPSVVLATRKYVDDKVIEVKAYADNLLAQHIAAADPHPQYAPKNSPALTGKPTAPTAVPTENSTQLATTAFVKAAIAALVASSPAALDTLKELADALGNDANFSTTVMNALAGKQPLNATLTELAGKDVAGLLAYLGIGTASLTNAGLVRLSDNTEVPDSTTAATTSAVNYVLNQARTAINRADEKLAKTANGTDIPNKPAFRSALQLGAAALLGVGTRNDLSSGNTNLLATMDCVGAFLPRRTFNPNDLIRIPDVPGGLIIQWGTNAGQAIGYNTPFPNKCCAVFQIPQSADASPHGLVYHQVTGFDAGKFQRSNSIAMTYCDWLAIGF